MSSFFRRCAGQSPGSVRPEAAAASGTGERIKDVGGTAGPKRPVTLYLIRLSPPCRAVWLYLIQNKIQHTLVDVDPRMELDSEGRRPGLPSSVSHQDVPILVDGDVVVFEGPVILRYLATRYTNHAGFGQTMAERMMVESLVCWAYGDLHRVMGFRCAYPQVIEEFRLENETANEALIETGLRQLTQYLERLDKRYLAGSPFLCGQAPTAADSAVATVLLQAEWIGLSLRLWPRLDAWLPTVTRQPGWAEVHAEHSAFVSRLRADILYPTPDIAAAAAATAAKDPSVKTKQGMASK